jgi:hypothetical protein
MLDARYPYQVASYRVEAAESPQSGISLSHPARSRTLNVNPAGAIIWTLCDGQRTVAEIAQILGEAYPESVPEIARNVRDTLLALTEYGAIEWT